MESSTHAIRLANWMTTVQTCRQSGLSIRKWCSENQINEKQFYYWQRCVRKELCQERFSEKAEPLNVTFAEVSAAKLTLPVESSRFQADLVVRTETLTIEITNGASERLLAFAGQVVSHAR